MMWLQWYWIEHAMRELPALRRPTAFRDPAANVKARLLLPFGL
jgi:hypothetical protein